MPCILCIGAVGAVTGLFLHGFGAAAATSFGPLRGAALQTAAHGAVGGAFNAANGGSFKDGFIGGAVGNAVDLAFIGPQSALANVPGIQGVALRTGIAAVSGGVAAELSGGKFANGAVTAAFFHLFNQEAERFVANSAKRNSGFFGTLKMIWRDSIISESFKDGTRDWGNMTYDMFTPGSPLADHGAYDANADWVNWSRGANVVAATTMAAAGGSSLFYGGGGTALWTGGLETAGATSAASASGLTTYNMTLGGRLLTSVFGQNIPHSLLKFTSGVFAGNAHRAVTVLTRDGGAGPFFAFERAVIQFLRNAAIEARFLP